MMLAAPLLSAETATFDSAGAITSLIRDGAEFPVHGRLVATFEGEVEATLQPHDQKSAIVRAGLLRVWSGETTFPNGRRGRFEGEWTETEGGLLSFAGTVANPGEAPLLVRTLDYVLDLPRAAFLGGRVEPGGAVLSSAKSEVVQRGSGLVLKVTDAANNWTVELRWGSELPFEVSDHWDDYGRSLRVRLRLWSGPLGKEKVPVSLSLRLGGRSIPGRVALSVDPRERWQPFDGFGANYCWGTETAATSFLLENLRIAWSRHELKAILWDRERGAPGPTLVRDFERIRSIQTSGVPWIISLWRLPERFYTDANRVPTGTFGRKIAGERWPEVLELIGSYLLHLKQTYGAEPALISFNEPDLGVDIGLTPEEHREAVKRIGAHLAALGLKTRFLLGDTANPRDTHRYVLPTAADAEALRHVGAVSFHSWNGGTPEQYRAWAEVAAWLRLPVLVGEAGTDPGSWRNRTFDSYSYGLGEARQVFEILRHARPQASLYWQFTADYGLVRTRDDGVVEPTGRFWLMKHFTNLTPQHGWAVASTSDAEGVRIAAFAKDEELVVHLLNSGPPCIAALAGLPPGLWQSVTTTEDHGFVEAPPAPAPAEWALPARSLTTLVRVAVAPATP